MKSRIESRCRVFAAVALASAALQAVVAADVAPSKNIFRDDFVSNGAGGFLDWCISRGEATVEMLPEPGPTGKRAVRISGDKAPAMLSHTTMQLAAGEPYRISAWVRTSGLDPEDASLLLVYNQGWSKTLQVAIPADTHGKWVNVKKTGNVPHTTRCHYGGVYLPKLPPGARLDVSAITLEPMSEKGRSESSCAYVSNVCEGRLVPVHPLLAEIDASDASLELYWTGDMPDDGKSPLVTGEVAGRNASARLGADRKATLRFGTVPPGRHELTVRIVSGSGKELAANGYRIKASIRKIWPEEGRRLNNFVTELFTKPLVDGEYRFTNPRDGWVYVGFDKPYPGVFADVDGIADAVKYREAVPSSTMRMLRAGLHTVRIRGAAAAPSGAFSVRLVKTIRFSASRLRFEKPTDFSRRHYARDYYARYVYPNMNMASLVMNGNADALPGLRAELTERGIGFNDCLGFSCLDKRRAEKSTLFEALSKLPQVRAKRPVSFDENLICVDPVWKYNFAEAMWRLYDPGFTVDMWWADAQGYCFGPPRVQISEVSALLNSGDGSALFFPEVYLRTPDTEKAAFDGQDEHYRRFVASARELMPAAPGRIVYALGGWATMGVWMPWCCPEADIKALYDHFMLTLATDPAFREIGGAGFSSPACDEPLLRFTAELMRHYCIEGSTSLMRPELRYLPGHMDNGEFSDGFRGWTVNAAEPGSLTNGYWRSYARVGQNRMGSSNGSYFAVFTRSAKGANRLSRELAGLVPGKTYELTFCTADLADIIKPGAKSAPPCVFSADVRGAEILPEHCYDYTTSGGSYGTKRPYVTTHHVAFRALASTATVVFSDWKSEGEPGGETGAARALNFVGVRRFFEPDVPFPASYRNGGDRQ